MRNSFNFFTIEQDNYFEESDVLVFVETVSNSIQFIYLSLFQRLYLLTDYYFCHYIYLHGIFQQKLLIAASAGTIKHFKGIAIDASSYFHVQRLPLIIQFTDKIIAHTQLIFPHTLKNRYRARCKLYGVRCCDAINENQL